MPRDEHKSVRQALAEHTRSAHETLHHHRWISCLTSPTLTTDQYYCILQAYLQFYRQIESERRRLGELNELNLNEAITYLESDTAHTREHHQSGNQLDDLVFDDTSSTLGALYVLHGARFGAAILNKQVAATLPDVPRSFLKNSTPREQWRELTATIETLAADKASQQALFSSADRTFKAFGKSVTQYCESASL